jgi:hypothetical protein
MYLSRLLRDILRERGFDDVFTYAPGVSTCPEPIVCSFLNQTKTADLIDAWRYTTELKVYVTRASAYAANKVATDAFIALRDIDLNHLPEGPFCGLPDDVSIVSLKPTLPYELLGSANLASYVYAIPITCVWDMQR